VRREFLRAVPGIVLNTATAEAMPPLAARPFFMLVASWRCHSLAQCKRDILQLRLY
jgi:hypothetical protein